MAAEPWAKSWHMSDQRLVTLLNVQADAALAATVSGSSTFLRSYSFSEPIESVAVSSSSASHVAPSRSTSAWQLSRSWRTASSSGAKAISAVTVEGQLARSVNRCCQCFVASSPRGCADPTREAARKVKGR